MSRKTGLHLEIIVSLSLVVGAALLFGALLLLRLTEQELVEQRVAAVTALTRSVITASLSGADNADRRQRLYRVVELLRSLQGEAAPESWSVVDAELKPLVVFDTVNGIPATTLELRLARFSPEPMVRLRYQGSWLPLAASEHVSVSVTVPLAAPVRSDGVLQLVFSLEGVRARMLRAHRLVLVYVVFYGAVLVGFGSYLLGRNVVRPVRQLLTATHGVAAGDLSQQLPVDGPGEVAELAASFNRMLEALRQSRAETEAHIASLQQVNSELRDTRRELLRSERLASVGHLAAGMSHEIGNPLGAIIGYLELVRGELVDPRQVDLVERSLTEASRIDRLVRDLLDFSAPERDGLTYADPAQVLSEAQTLLARQGKFDGIAVCCEIAEPLPMVPVNGHKLLQVLINLLLNACDAMPDGGRLDLRGALVAGRVHLTVADSGGGISEETQAKMFDPFFSTKPEGKGRGLGLAICHRIVEEAGGRIEVRSATDGTTFTLILPSGGA